MVSTATPTAWANCSIRYSMSKHFNAPRAHSRHRRGLVETPHSRLRQPGQPAPAIDIIAELGEPDQLQMQGPVEGDDSVDQRETASEVEAGAKGCRHRQSATHGHLGGIERSGVNPEVRSR